MSKSRSKRQEMWAEFKWMKIKGGEEKKESISMFGAEKSCKDRMNNIIQKFVECSRAESITDCFEKETLPAQGSYYIHI